MKDTGSARIKELTDECRGNKAQARLMQSASLTGDNNNASKDSSHSEFRNAFNSLTAEARTSA